MVEELLRLSDIFVPVLHCKNINHCKDLSGNYTSGVPPKAEYKLKLKSFHLAALWATLRFYKKSNYSPDLYVLLQYQKKRQT